MEHGQRGSDMYRYGNFQTPISQNALNPMTTSTATSFKTVYNAVYHELVPNPTYWILAFAYVVDGALR